MKELNTTTDIVKEILIADKNARNSDNYLCFKVYSKIAKSKGIDFEKMSISEFFLHSKEFGFPSTETVRRTRQKIQHDNPELSAHSDVKMQRAILEEAYREFARGC